MKSKRLKSSYYADLATEAAEAFSKAKTKEERKLLIDYYNEQYYGDPDSYFDGTPPFLRLLTDEEIKQVIAAEEAKLIQMRLDEELLVAGRAYSNDHGLTFPQNPTTNWCIDGAWIYDGDNIFLEVWTPPGGGFVFYLPGEEPTKDGKVYY